MKHFSYKPAYFENDRKVLEVNILPEKYCNFDCIFCPIGRSDNVTDETYSFDGIEEDLAELQALIIENQPDLVFINPKGEGLVHDGIAEIIESIKSSNIKVRLLTNGYLLNDERFKYITNLCDEVIGEMKVTRNEDFIKIQRPLKGYSIEQHIDNMASFNKDYNGKFILELTIIKGYSDDEHSIIAFKNMINHIKPSEVQIVTIDKAPFNNKLGVDELRLMEISKGIMEC